MARGDAETAHAGSSSGSATAKRKRSRSPTRHEVPISGESGCKWTPSGHGHKPPRYMLYVKRYVHLDEYKAEIKAGKYQNMTREDKIRVFQSSIAPIHVPLAKGESAEQYEARFIVWLEKKKGLQLKDLARDKDENRERFYRFKFASANVWGTEKFEPKASETGDDRTPKDQPHEKGKRDTSGEPPRNCPGKALPADTRIGAAVGMHMSCGCQTCLLQAMKALQTRLQSVGSSIRQRCKCRAKRPVDLTGDHESPKRRRLTAEEIQRAVLSRPAACELGTRVVSIAEATPELEDVVLSHLQQEYNQINDRVLKATKQAKSNAVDQGEYRARDLALAKLGVHMWRHQRDELIQMTGFKPSTDQRSLHLNCALAASVAREAREEAEKLRLELEKSILEMRVADMRRIGEQLTQKEADIRTVEKTWRREIAALLQASQQLKQLVILAASPRTERREWPLAAHHHR